MSLIIASQSSASNSVRIEHVEERVWHVLVHAAMRQTKQGYIVRGGRNHPKFSYEGSSLHYAAEVRCSGNVVPVDWLLKIQPEHVEGLSFYFPVIEYVRTAVAAFIK